MVMGPRHRILPRRTPDPVRVNSAATICLGTSEIPDQHHIPMRLRDWFAPVTVIALEACISP